MIMIIMVMIILLIVIIIIMMIARARSGDGPAANPLHYATLCLSAHLSAQTPYMSRPVEFARDS